MALPRAPRRHEDQPRTQGGGVVEVGGAHTGPRRHRCVGERHAPEAKAIGRLPLEPPEKGRLAHVRVHDEDQPRAVEEEGEDEVGAPLHDLAVELHVGLGIAGAPRSVARRHEVCRGGAAAAAAAAAVSSVGVRDTGQCEGRRSRAGVGRARRFAMAEARTEEEQVEAQRVEEDGAACRLEEAREDQVPRVGHPPRRHVGAHAAKIEPRHAPRPHLGRGAHHAVPERAPVRESCDVRRP